MSDGLPAIKTKHLDIIEKYGGKYAGKALAVIAAAQVATPIVKKGVEWVQRHEDYTITVDGADDIYPDLHEWVLARMPERERKAMIASTGEGRRYLSHDIDENHPVPPIHLRYDGSREQEVAIDGCQVTVTVEKDTPVSTATQLPDNWKRLLEKIKFSTDTSQGRDAVIAMIEGLHKARYEKSGPPPLLIPSRWGGSWNTRNDLPSRMLESVILKEGQIERLVEDLEVFLASEEEYDRASQPWHRGYLFWGCPGTGKSSIVKALANHFGMPLYYLPLGDLEKDADLMGLVGDIKPRSILLLEDVDVFHAMTDRNDDERGATIAAMLNALDGVWTPHGLITVMTTNNRDKLDEALIRPGRVDVDEEFTALDEDQAARLSKWIWPEQEVYPFSIQKFVGKSPAKLIKRIRKEQQKERLT